MDTHYGKCRNFSNIKNAEMPQRAKIVQSVEISPVNKFEGVVLNERVYRNVSLDKITEILSNELTVWKSLYK